MKRSKWKGPFLPKSDNLKLLQRSCEITSNLVGSSIETHSGNKYIKLSISEEMVGFKAGEFAPTREKFVFKKKKKKK